MLLSAGNSLAKTSARVCLSNLKRRLSRHLSVSIPVRNSTSTLSRSTELGAVEETQDVTTMDRLLTVAPHPSVTDWQARNPTLLIIRNVDFDCMSSEMPMRSRTLWSEALLRESLPPGPLAQHETPPPSAEERELTPRNMHDSYCELVLPFASSPQLLEQYTNASGGIRTGMLMEHLDSLAGSVAYKHMLGPGVNLSPRVQGFYVVTASVDRLDMLASLYPVRNMRLSGQVIHTGRSSMEVAVRMEALDEDGTEETVLLGRFCMVCRDARTHRSTPVHPLSISTPEDHMLFTIGEVHKNRRQSRASRSLNLVPPTSEEAEALHSLYLKYGRNRVNVAVTPDGERVWMGDTRVEKTLMMYPQERNVHQKIFGGYLMRLAYELGFANSVLFTRGHVSFLSLDGIAFARPVPIGSILRLTSYIVHSTSSEQFPALVHVWVQANVVDPQTGAEQTTNDFRFTWCREHGAPLTRMVVPRTYTEAMQWLEGKRALEMGSEIRLLRKNRHA
ncbi:Acyl-coenzyme A thioesterase 9, mitochondrial [Grifola frondosa]|uniref:Acyl-coenzyme A thioesterase 9, mitochondrial n=1 Tax=Grifola frondosa TaxID=5627 RepID=A0A1C7MCV2_GRIFR|nr:Acyl-coenzyme A thioesterase 9, mitochondrial [Grifola frondosa]